MNIHGGLFPGGVSILHGANQNLAWAHTANGIDKIDVFKLEMQPKHKNRRYSFDGKWLPLERAKAKMHIKGIPFAVGKKVFWSKYGATIKTKQGYFAVRLYANQTIKAAEQWWRMGLANNYEEFHKALEMRGLPIMNINYIDRYDTLFFIHNTVIPNRNPQYNWRGTVPGNTAQTLWDTYLPLSQNPQIRNPACGYTYNVNHSPFLGTAAADAPKPQDYPGGIASFDMRANNRSLRFEELLRKEDKISLGCLQEMRNDLQLPKESEFWHNLRALQNIDLNIHPDLTDVVTEMRLWNGSFDTLSTGASVAYLALIPLFERFGNSSQVFCYDVGVTEAQAVAYLREAQTHLRKYFGTTHLPLGKLQRLRHGNKDYAIGGCPDVLAAMYGLPQKDGTFAAARGDDFIMYVQYDKDKPAPTIQSMRAFGNSSRPNSPHYTDQMELFLRKQPRTVYSFDPVGLQQHTERVYHPTLAPPIN